MRPSATVRRTAYHEAGHVVLAYLGGLRVLGVSVERDDDSLGRTLSGFLALGRSTPATSGRARSQLEARVLYYLAGMEAEARFAGRRARQGASSDLAEAAEYAWQAVLSDEELDPYLRWLEARARHLVGVHWRLIDGLARRLLQHETMNARQVREALQAISVARRSRRRRSGARRAAAARRGR